MLPEIPGELITDRNFLRGLREEVARLLELTSSSLRFPGAQPVSFNAKHLETLKSENFFVSEKADGVRVLVYTHCLENNERLMFLIDRMNNYYCLKVGLISPNGCYHLNTILDAELVYEKRGIQMELQLLFFDALVMDGKNICEKPYTGRLGYLREHFLSPHLSRCNKDRQFSGRYPFKISQKRVHLAYNLLSVFQDMETYRHETDGVIFTSCAAPYVTATNSSMLKWKPAEENTVDFMVLKVDDKFHLGILVETKPKDIYEDFGKLTLSDEMNEEWNKDPPIGKIIECRYSKTWPNNWQFSRFRPDKNTSNFITVYEKIIKSINDNISKDQLLGIVDEVYQNWKVRDPKTPAPRNINDNKI